MECGPHEIHICINMPATNFSHQSKGPPPARSQEFQFVELFAGSRMATRCVAGAGYRATALDINDHQTAGYALGEGSVFDINSYSGLPLLGQKLYSKALSR